MKKHLIALSIITVFVIIGAIYVYFKMIVPPPVMDAYEIMCICILIALAALIYLVYYLAFIKKVPFHKCYLPVGLVFGAIFMFVIPPYVTPDEPSHIWSTYYVSNKVLGYETEDPTAIMALRACEVGAPLQSMVTRASYNQIFEYMVMPVVKEDLSLIDTNNLYNTPLYLYIIPSIGVTLGRLLSLGVVPTLFLGTLGSMLVFVFSAYYALKKVPFGKMIIAGFCLLPMVLQQTSSFSYDSIVLASTIVVIALGLRWGFTEERPTTSEMVVYLLYSIFLIGGKGGAYSVFCFLPMLYGLSKEKLKVLWKDYRKQIIILMVMFVVIMFSGTIKTVLNSTAVSNQEISEEGVDAGEEAEESKNIIGWAGEEGYTISWVLEHPVETIRSWYYTFVCNWSFYLYTMFGSSLGWWQIGIPVWVIWIYGGMALVNTISIKGEKQMSIPDRVWVTLLSVFSCVMFMAAMFFFWSPKSYGIIVGIQGRYFLPPYLAMMYCIRNNKIALKWNLEKPLLFANVILASVAVWFVMRNF